MASVEIIDYAMPCMKAERALKKLHDAMLARDYNEALKQATFAIVEAKMVYNSILHEKEQHDQGRRVPT